MTELRAALADTSPMRTSSAPSASLPRSTRSGRPADQARMAGRARADTGLTRETIRRHIEDERIRRGEIRRPALPPRSSGACPQEGPRRR